MKKTLFVLALLSFGLLAFQAKQPTNAALQGAWKSDKGVVIFVDGFFSYTGYSEAEQRFDGTRGGSFTFSGKEISLEYEFHTINPEKVGTTEKAKTSLKGNTLTMGGEKFTRLDDGTPGDLAGAWLITGRKVDDEVRTITPGVRRTMKILSGSRFQWIAYNVETKEFSGTGGGSYTTEDGKYIEKIDFFSRDNTRVGMSLGFDYELKDGHWHHSGKSSKGDPIYEIWSKR